MGTTIDAVAVATGGRRRRLGSLRLADDATRACLALADVAPNDVDLLVNAGVYRDRNLGEPALAALIQEDIGANLGDPPVGGHGTFSFDVANGACGALTALQLVDGLLAAGTAERALVVASDADPGHGLAPGFPFGATGAAMLCGHDDDVRTGFAGFAWRTFPDYEDQFRAEVRFEGHRNVLVIDEHPEFAGRAADAAAEVAAKLLAEHGLAAVDVDAIVASPLLPAFLERLAAGLGTPRERVVAVESHGAHTAALLIALAALRHDDRFRDARTVLLVTAGAGITAGAALYQR
jgi:3-oxoacyl-[acyl-carrier-protein] synthase III